MQENSMLMAEKTGMVDKICPIYHYLTVHRPPLEVAHPWGLSWVVESCCLLLEEEGNGVCVCGAALWMMMIQIMMV